MIALLNVIAPGPGMPPAALIDADAVGGTQNSATVVGSDESGTHEPTAQSALLVHVVAFGSSVQYDPSGDGSPVREIRFSKHGRLNRLQGPLAPAFVQSALLVQPRNGWSTHSPTRAVGLAAVRIVVAAALLEAAQSARQVRALVALQLLRRSRPLPQVCPASHSASLKHGASGSPSQKPQWQYTPQDTGCAGAAAQEPAPVQSALLVHAVVGSSVQR